MLMASTAILYVILLILLSFVPAIIYVRWFRNLEQFSKEPYGAVLGTFLWGAITAIFLAGLLEYVLFRVTIYEYELHRFLDFPAFLVMVVIVAPLVEEFVKPLGILARAKKDTDEVEDGMIYGAICGLGFAATENLLYGVSALVSDGISTASLLVGVRTISSTLLHASATAITGYGIGLWLVKRRSAGIVLPYFLYAVVLHAGYNLLAMTNLIIGFVFAVMMAILVTDFIKRKIIDLDQRSALKDMMIQIRKQKLSGK